MLIEKNDLDKLLGNLSKQVAEGFDTVQYLKNGLTSPENIQYKNSQTGKISTHEKRVLSQDIYDSINTKDLLDILSQVHKNEQTSPELPFSGASPKIIDLHEAIENKNQNNQLELFKRMFVSQESENIAGSTERMRTRGRH